MSCVQETMNLLKSNLKRTCDEIAMIERSQTEDIVMAIASPIFDFICPLKKTNYKQRI